MQVIYSATANKTLLKVALFVETLNTKGSGIKWKNRFQRKISKYAMPIKYALCRYKIHAKYGYSCVAIDDWIIVFKIVEDSFFVKYIVLGSNLK